MKRTMKPSSTFKNHVFPEFSYLKSVTDVLVNGKQIQCMFLSHFPRFPYFSHFCFIGLYKFGMWGRGEREREREGLNIYKAKKYKKNKNKKKKKKK